MHNGQFGPKPVYEAPLFGAVIGGLIGGGGTLAGILTTGGLIGTALGAVGGTLLGDMLSPKMPSFDISAPKAPTQQQVQQATPPAPPAPAIPATPATPAATPVTGGGLGAPTGPGGAPTPVDTSGPAPTPFIPGEAAPPTPQDVAAGELTRKRKGRVSTILTTSKSRMGQDTDDEEEIERLGG